MRTLCVSAALGALCLQTAWAKPFPLTLDIALERAQQNNRPFKAAKLALEDAEINYNRAFHRTWLPSLTLSATTTSAYTLGRIPGKNADTLLDSQDKFGYPTTAITLGLAEYTIYNFGRDAIAYEQARLDHERSLTRFEETRRSLDFRTTNAYYQLKTAVDGADTAERSFNIAMAIARLQSSKIPLGTATREEYESARVDAITARTQLEEARQQVSARSLELNNLLGDPLGAEYDLMTKLDYQPVRLEDSQALLLYRKAGPRMVDARLAALKAGMNVELAEKNRLPVPTLKLSGVNLQFRHDYSSSAQETYTSASGNSNFNVNVGITLSLPIFDESGILGHRAVAQARIAQQTAEIEVGNSQFEGEVLIRNMLAQIRQLERNIKSLEETLKSSSSVLDKLFENLSKAKNVSRLDLRDALATARANELAVQAAYLSHLTTTLQLAETLGVNDLNEGEL